MTIGIHKCFPEQKCHLEGNLRLVHATLPLGLHVVLEGLGLLGVGDERLAVDLAPVVGHPLQLGHFSVIRFHPRALEDLREIFSSA